MAGAHAAVGFLLALEHRRRTGAGTFVEAPMVGASLNIAAEQIVEYSAYGNLITRQGNRSRWSIPQGVYRTGDVDDTPGGRWIAISVATDDQWRALCGAIDASDWADDERLATAALRRFEHDRIDERLGAWCAAHTSDAIVTALQGLGVPCEPVIAAHDQAALEQTQSRNLFEHLVHPLAGSARFIREPFRMSSGPTTHNRRHAPLLGEHNRDILTRVLGRSDAEVDALERDGILGQVVVGGSLL
jgi:crotonobetainyl-CoA:carnitine CoA-transferase CaiB-like acyl-CoA transferase